MSITEPALAIIPSPAVTRPPVPVMACLAGQTEVFNHYDSNEAMWSGNGERTAEKRVTFDPPFAAIPTIQVALAAIDATHEQNLRFHVRAKDITPEGFTVEMMTWSDTRIARATASWFAFGERASAVRQP